MAEHEKPDWALAMRVLPDGRTLYVVPLTFGRARLTISAPGDVYGYYAGY